MLLVDVNLRKGEHIQVSEHIDYYDFIKFGGVTLADIVSTWASGLQCAGS